MNIFLELHFDYSIYSNTYNEIQHFVEKYKLNKQLRDIKLVYESAKDYTVVFLLTNISSMTDLEAFLEKYNDHNSNKFGQYLYPEPDHFKLKPSEIRWGEFGSGAGGCVEREINWKVTLKHLPTNIYVECELEGTQKANKAMARRLLTAIVYKTTKTEEDWRNYLLGIGVVNLNDDDEISEKLDKVERENPKYKESIVQALNELNLLESIPIQDVRIWLESLGN